MSWRADASPAQPAITVKKVRISPSAGGVSDARHGESGHDALAKSPRTFRIGAVTEAKAAMAETPTVERPSPEDAPEQRSHRPASTSSRRRASTHRPGAVVYLELPKIEPSLVADGADVTLEQLQGQLAALGPVLDQIRFAQAFLASLSASHDRWQSLATELAELRGELGMHVAPETA